MKVLLFGTGDCYQKYKKWFAHVEVAGLLDNDINKAGTYVDGKEVLLPADGVKLDYDRIYILSVHEKEIRSQLDQLGVCQNKVYHYFDIRNSIHQKEKLVAQLYGDLSQKDSILFLSYDLNFNGASLALYHALSIMVKKGYHIVVASMNDGEMRSMILELEIPVIIDANLQIATFAEVEWAQEYSVIFCNTLNFYQMLSERDLRKRFIWWLHEPEIFYNGINTEVLHNIALQNLYIYAAGPPAAAAYCFYRPDSNVRMLFYGLTDWFKQSQLPWKEKDKMRFALIGNLQKYKAQDILADAIRLLDEHVRRKAEFYFAGTDTGSKYASELHKKTETINEVIFTGVLKQREIHEILKKIDVLVCPSRQDTMPTVAAEAMMHGVPCIISDHVGTASLIKDQENGIIFECENVRQLSMILKKCIEGGYNLKQMGEKARKVYEQFFSMKVFEENLIRIFQTVMR